MRALFQQNAVGAVADHAEHRVDPAVAQALEGDEHVIRPLHRRHAADPTHGEAVAGNAEIAPAFGAAVGLGRDALVQFDAEPNDDETLPGSDTEGDQVVANLGADSDQSSRANGEPAFEQPEEERANGPEVTPEDVAVERVHDDRRPP